MSAGISSTATQTAESIVAATLCDMASRRSLHAALHEAAQAWKDVAPVAPPEKLAAAWSWLFAGHSVERVPLNLATESQLPAWGIQGGRIGVVTHLARDNEALRIEWAGGEPGDAKGITELLVPVAPFASGEAGSTRKSKRGPATQAILAAVGNHAPLFVRVGFVSIFINLIAIVASLFAMQVYDRVVPNFAYATLWVLASGVFLAYLFDVLFKAVRVRLLETSARRLDEALSLHFFEKVLALKVDRRPSRVGTLVGQIRDYESIKAFFTSTTLFVITDIPFVFLFIFVIGMIGGNVAWVMIIFVPICVIIALLVYRPLARMQREENDEINRRQGILFEAVSGAEIIKSQGGESRFGDTWLRSTRESGARGEQLRLTTANAHFATAFFQQIAYVFVLIVGVYEIEAGKLTMGGMIACAILSGRVLSNIAMTTGVLLQWHHASYALEVLNKLLETPSDDSPERQANTSNPALNITLRGVTYAYEGSRSPQLMIPALAIKSGERLAVLGRNGSGKSTLIKLLAGVGTPSGGELAVGGIDLQLCRPSWLREVVGYVPQDVRLFSGTLLENLTLGLNLPSEASIREALQKTGLIGMVDRHPQGLMIPIKEGGYGLSGGQRQLVGLTRLLLQNPKIWLLDEPSASLDSDSEERIMKLIRELPRDRTIVFTTHRPTWLALADRVILMEDGAIKADSPADKVRAISQGQAKAMEAAGTAVPTKPAPVVQQGAA